MGCPGPPKRRSLAGANWGCKGKPSSHLEEGQDHGGHPGGQEHQPDVGHDHNGLFAGIENPQVAVNQLVHQLIHFFSFLVFGIFLSLSDYYYKGYPGICQGVF